MKKSPSLWTGMFLLLGENVCVDCHVPSLEVKCYVCTGTYCDVPFVEVKCYVWTVMFPLLE